jgi:hypothetical protein
MGACLFLSPRIIKELESLRNPTPTITLGSSSLQPEDTEPSDEEPAQEVHALDADCEALERAYEEKAWQEVLNIAASAAAAQPDDFSELVHTAPCAWEEHIREAGYTLGWRQYNAEEYGTAMATAEQLRERLERIGRFDETDRQETILLTQCSTYWLAWSSGDYNKAEEALMALRELTSGYQLVHNHCGFKLVDAQEDLEHALTPTATLTPTPMPTSMPTAATSELFRDSLLPIQPQEWQTQNIGDYIYPVAGSNLPALSLYKYPELPAADLWLNPAGFSLPVQGIHFEPADTSYNWGLLVQAAAGPPYRLIVEDGEDSAYVVRVKEGNTIVKDIPGENLPTLEIRRVGEEIVFSGKFGQDSWQEFHAITWRQGATYGVYIVKSNYPVRIASLDVLLAQ